LISSILQSRFGVQQTEKEDLHYLPDESSKLSELKQPIMILSRPSPSKKFYDSPEVIEILKDMKRCLIHPAVSAIFSVFKSRSEISVKEFETITFVNIGEDISIIPIENMKVKVNFENIISQSNEIRSWMESYLISENEGLKLDPKNWEIGFCNSLSTRGTVITDLASQYLEISSSTSDAFKISGYFHFETVLKEESIDQNSYFSSLPSEILTHLINFVNFTENPTSESEMGYFNTGLSLNGITTEIQGNQIKMNLSKNLVGETYFSSLFSSSPIQNLLEESIKLRKKGRENIKMKHLIALDGQITTCRGFKERFQNEIEKNYFLKRNLKYFQIQKGCCHWMVQSKFQIIQI